MLTSFIRVLFSLSFFFLSVDNIRGQNHTSKPKTEDSLAIKVLKTGEVPIDFKRAYHNLNKFLPQEDLNFKTHPKNTYWILLDFGNNAKSKLKERLQYLRFNCFDYGNIFYNTDGSIIKKNIGNFDTNTLSERTNSSKYYCQVPFVWNSLIENRYLILEVRRVKFIESINNWTFSYKEVSQQNIYKWNNIKSSIPLYIYLGIGSIISIAMLVFYIYFRKIEFLFYSLFVFSKIIYLFKGELILFDRLHLDDTLLKSWLLDSNTIFVGVIYNLFILFYLNLKEDYPKAFYFIKVGVYVHFFILVADLFFLGFKYHLGHIYLIQVLRIVSFLITFLFLVYLLLYQKNRISTFFLLGAGSFNISVIIYYYLNIDSASDPMLYGNSLVLIIGSSLEIIFFAFGLTYKAFNEYLKGLYFRQAAVINKNKALRAQINPHFIFNALGSIQHLILQKKNHSALNYLTKFSRMARNALEASVEGTATLDEEIEMLKDYLELESLRFDNAFSYKLKIEDKLTTSEIEIPFMISQPFVENAIIHGLLPKNSGKKELTISFEEKEGALTIIIDDNGIGRNYDKKNSRSYHKKKSRGLEVTLTRLESWPYGAGELKILDKLDGNRVSIGTKVIIAIPLIPQE